MKNTDIMLTLKEEQGVQSRRHILEAALDLMAQRGYAGASISAISKQSGLPVSSIYWHFESKEGLLAAVLEDGARNFVDGLPKFEKLKGSHRERVGLLMRDLARRLGSQPRFLRLLILMGLEHRHSDSAVLENIRSIRRQTIEGSARSIANTILAGHPEKDEFARKLATLLLVIADGAFIAHQIDPNFNLEELFELQFQALAAMLPPDR